MTKTIYIATDANGTAHKRSTESRAYTHTVVIQYSKDHAIERANKRVASNLERAREYFRDAAATIDELKAVFIAKKCNILARNDDYAIECIEKGKAFVAQWGNPEAYAADCHMNDIAKIEATNWSEWHNAGWCGRRDLADKLAAKERANDYARRAAVAILDAVEQPSKQKVAA